MSLPSNYEVEGQLSIFEIFSPDIWSGKMSQEPLAQTKERTSDAYLKKQRKSSVKMPLFLDLRGGGGVHQDALWEMGGQLLGVYMMHSFGECPSEERESHLSQILEVNPHRKYCLSARACQGILNRAERRGKILPEILYKTLIKQAQSASKNEQVNQGGVKEYSSNTIESEHCQHSTINPSCGINGDKAETLDSNYFKGCGQRQGKKREVVFCLQGNGIDRADTAGCNGKGWREDESYTLNTIDRHAVCASQDAYDKYSINETAATIKQSGGVYGGEAKR